ncbi:hypothetical protein HQ563_14260 [bacterium]|nr:hypothetical protein [bacterium]
MKGLATVAALGMACAVIFPAKCVTHNEESVTGEHKNPAVPLVRAHAHNDYEHRRPLLDALDHGFCSVEADIHLVDGKLLVAHDRDKVKRRRTLQALYLEPLRQRVKRNGGRVYRGGPEFTLLIDIKSDAESTYAALCEVLTQYADILTQFGPGGTQTEAVTAIVSGNRAREVMAEEAQRYCAMDGRLSDLDSDAPRHLIPLISDSWGRVFRWRGKGEMPEAERRKLKRIVGKIHQRGCRARFWGTPDTPAVWRETAAAGVDLINTDDLPGLQKFLLTLAGKGD